MPSTSPRPHLSALLLPLLVLLWGFWQFRGFVQDDAFISLRFSANLARGHGLVFNPGEPVEGFTNMLWTLLGGVTWALGLPSLEIWQGIGFLSSLGTLALVYLITFELAGLLPALGAALIFASSTTVHAWSGSGMESPFFALLLVLAGYAELRGRSRTAFGLLGVAQWTRPEALLAAGALLYVKLRVSASRNSLDRTRIAQIAKDFAFYLVPSLLLSSFRWVYYGTLVPNTYLVKGSGSAANHLLGLHKLEKLAIFGGMGLTWIPLFLLGTPSWKGSQETDKKFWPAFVGGAVIFFLIDIYLRSGGFWHPDWSLFAALRGDKWSLPWPLVSALLGGFGIGILVAPGDLLKRPFVAWSAYFWLGMLYFYVRVGGDLLPMHRLFLPALPFQAILASLGAARFSGPDGFGSLAQGDLERAEIRGACFGVLSCFLLTIIGLSVQKSASQGHFRTVQSALDHCHGQAGRDLEKIAKTYNSHPSVLAQDMGALPLNALDLRFIDSIGLTDGPIAHILWEYRYSPYFRYLIWEDEKARTRFAQMEARLREHLTQVRKPDYAVINVHLEAKDTENARRAARELDGAYFYPFLRDNVFFYKWTESDYFRENYVLMRAYEYSTVHFLVTFRRRDQPTFPSGV
jgi:hypothetical protein